MDRAYADLWIVIQGHEYNNFQGGPTDSYCTQNQLIGLIVAVRGLRADLGELCEVQLPTGRMISAEVVGFRRSDTLIMPLGELGGIGPGTTPTEPGYSTGSAAT